MLAVSGGLVCAGFAFGLRINLTSSHVEAGIWRAAPADSIEVGDVIGYSKDEFYALTPGVREDRMIFRAPMVIKRVAALPGATVELSGDAVVIDGVRYSDARIRDDTWRKVDYPLTVQAGSVWLMADSSNAYDSRYHGPLPVSLIREKLKPVWVW
jgi:type IV secretory pathway protease TraF